MSHLFTRLAQRATLTASVLERRARSLFEPVGPTGPGALQTVEAVAVAEPPSAAAQAPQPAPADAAPPTTQRPAGPPTTGTRPNPPSVVEAAPTLARPSRPAALHRADETEPSSVRSSAQRAPEPPRTPPVAPKPLAESPHRGPRAKNTPPHERVTVTEHRVEIARTVRGAAPEAVVRQAPAPPPQPQPVTAPRAEAVLQPRTLPTPPAQLARARAEAPVRAVPAPAPILQFSIGRVEVRAPSATPEKRQSSRPAGPKLSLEAYLDGRSGGGR